MTAILTRGRFVLTTAALAISLAGCTNVTHGAAVLGDPGPCTHVDTPMLDVPVSRSSEPRMRLPQPAGWERTTDFEEQDAKVRFALSNGDGAIAVMITSMPDADAQAIFDDFHASLVKVLSDEGVHADVARTAGTLCGLPSELVSMTGDDPATTLAVVAESGGDTYLVTVVQVVDPENRTQRSDAETILTGFEVLPVEAAAA